METGEVETVFLNGKKQTNKQKNFSQFVSGLIVEFMGIQHPDDLRSIREKLIILEMNTLYSKRDNTERKLKNLASELTELRNLIKNGTD